MVTESFSLGKVAFSVGGIYFIIPRKGRWVA